MDEPNHKEFTLNEIDTNYCNGCSYTDINPALKVIITEPTRSVIVLCEKDVQDWSIKLPMFKFDTFKDHVVSMAMGVKISKPLLYVYALLQGKKDFLANAEDFVQAVIDNRKITVLLINDIEDYQSSSFDPMIFALSNGATFVGQEFADHPGKLSSLILKANQSQGPALVNIIQPCRNNHHKKMPIVKINDEQEKKDREGAVNLVMASHNKFALTGIIFSESNRAINLGTEKNILHENFTDILNKLR